MKTNRAKGPVDVRLGLIVILLGSSAASPQQPKAPAPQAGTPAAQYRALLEQYCVGCHNQRAKTANLMFDTMDLADLGKRKIRQIVERHKAVVRR